MVAAILVLSATAAQATVTFSNAYAEPSHTEVGTAFFTVVSSEDDAIVGAASDCCTAVELHKNEVTNNIMRMRKIDALPLNAGVPEAFQRSGADASRHTMLIGLKQPLKPGDRVAVTFAFTHAPKQTVVFGVKPAAAPVPMMDHTHMDMPSTPRK